MISLGGKQYNTVMKDHQRSRLFFGWPSCNGAARPLDAHAGTDGWIDATSCVFEPLYGDSWKALAKVKHQDMEQRACYY